MADFLKGSINPKNLLDTAIYNHNFRKGHPDYFYPEGLLSFCGTQGSGKTLSAVQYITKILKVYPKAVLVTNVHIDGIKNQVVEYNSLQELINLFDLVHNGEFGVVYFVDEIQVLFNALLRRNLDVRTLETISQQRKQRKHIVGTAQIFTKIDKVFREQMQGVVLCNKLLNCVQYNQKINGQKVVEVDGRLKYDVERSYVWFHSPKLYKLYDTSKIISSYRKEYNNNAFDMTALEKILKEINEGSVKNG